MEMPLVDLDKEYSPSAWSKRFANGKEAVFDHIKVVTEETHKNQEKYKCKANVTYGESDRQRMDIYFKEDKAKSIVVYIHGGYWQELTKEQSAYCVAPLVENGFRVIIVDYDLCPAVTLEEIINEIHRAIKFVFQYAKSTGARNISIIGHSAGAHLTVSILKKDYFREIALTDKLVNIFLVSGIYDLTDLQKTSINQGNLLCLNENNIRKCSPAFHSYQHLKESNIKFNVWVAENDSPTFIRQSKEFHEHLLRNGIDSAFQIVPDCDHFDIVENLSQEHFDLTQKIIELTKHD